MNRLHGPDFMRVFVLKVLVGILALGLLGCDGDAPKPVKKFPKESTNSLTTPEPPNPIATNITVTPALPSPVDPSIIADVINTAIAGVGSYRFGPVWNALPDTYRRDLQTVAKLALQIVDDTAHQNAVSVLQKAATVLPRKRDLIQRWAVSPQAADLNSTAARSLRHPDAVVALAVLVANSELATPAWRNNPDVERFLGGTAAQVLPQLEQLLAKTDPNQAQLRAFKALTKTLRVELPPPPRSTNTVLKVSFGTNRELWTFRQVEQKWVPDPLALRWNELMAGWRTALNTRLDNKDQLARQRLSMLRAIASANSALDQIDNAQTVQQVALAIGGLDAALSQTPTVRTYPGRQRQWIYGDGRADSINLAYLNQRQEVLLQGFGFPDERRPSRNPRADVVWVYKDMKIYNRPNGDSLATRLEFALKQGIVVSVQVAP